MAYSVPSVVLFPSPPPAGATDHGYTYPEVDLINDAPPLTAGGGSYLDRDAANTYFLSSFNAAAWGALTDAQKDVALAEASKWLDTLCWKGEKCDPAQPFSWPRKIEATGCCPDTTCSLLPASLIQATSELALVLHANQAALIGGAVTAATGPIKRQKLDALEVEYFDPRGSSGAAATTTKGPLVLSRFPWLKELLGCYANLGGNSLMLRVRS